MRVPVFPALNSAQKIANGMPRSGSSSITEQSIKACTKQFDLSLVYKLSMSNCGLKRIENLHLVPNLTELDLSHNRITQLEGLDGLESLKKLVLSSNEIARLEGLDTLESLERLELQGNRITNLDDVQCLTPLPCLRHVQLQVRGSDANQRNPVCDHPAYRNAMRRMLPSVQTLDGEHVILADAAMPQSAADALEELKLPDPDPWLKNFDWGEGDSGGTAGTGSILPLDNLDSMKSFEQAMTECKRMSAKAVSLVEDFKARTPR